MTPLLEWYFNRDSRTSRRRRTSSPSTWMNLTIRCRSELRRFCWLLLFLLLLAIFRPRPPEISIAVGGMFVDENNREPTHPHDSLITNLGAICATASTSVLICRWVIGSLANVCWWTFTLIFPPALRYTMVIKESKREFDIRLQHSATIYRREKIDQLRSLRPRLKVFSFLNMKSFADRSERVLVRRLVAPDVGWDEFYSSSDQHCNPLYQDEFLGYSSTVSYRMLTVLSW